MLSQLEGRVAVVTGAGSGIGAALCRRLSAEGMRVVAGDIDADAVAATAATLERGRGVPVDVADADSVRGFAEEAFEAFGRVDLLCNNAGVFQGGLSWERSEGDWDWVLGVNLYGIVHGISSFVPRMIAQGTDGHVVNTASVASFVSGPFSSPYIVSKSAALALSECLAHDLAAVESRIGVSVLVPSAIDTGIARTARVRPDRYGTDATADGALTVEFLEATTSAGLTPDEVTGPVVDAIQHGTFLIPTRPSYADQLRSRFDALAERQLPPMPPVD
jgi:NAD(P)-dependent dehydrogenase (short-subunit alcohol dehydrogenase family)